MQDQVKASAPGIVLDGILVEKMSASGVELVIGARRDPQWGPVLLVGLGGIWIEALADVQLLPADLDDAQIIAALRRLKGVKILDGIRGKPPVDMAAVAHATRKVADLMRERPEVVEVDINPFVVFAEGRGGVALDALIVLADD
jgi:acyl-CoA synthetase (NDP forming)